MMSGMQLPPEVFALIKDDARRNFAIDIETDSTLAADEQRDKQDVVELYDAIGRFTANLAPILSTPNDKQILKELLLFGVRKFKVGPNIEPLLENLGQEPEQQPQPDPRVAAAMAEIERKNAESQAKMQQEMQAFMAEQERKNKELMQDMFIERQEFENEQRRKDALNEARRAAI